MKGIFPPSKLIIGTMNEETRTSFLSAHAKFAEKHQVIYLNWMQVNDLQEDTTKEDRIEVQEEEKAVIKFSDSTITRQTQLDWVNLLTHSGTQYSLSTLTSQK